MGKEGGGIPTTWTGPYQFCSMAVFNPRRRRELWRFITYIVVHAGWQHLLINVFLQLLVGLPLEMSNGSLRVGTVYMSGALFGSLGVSAILPRKYLVLRPSIHTANLGHRLTLLDTGWRISLSLCSGRGPLRLNDPQLEGRSRRHQRQVNSTYSTYSSIPYDEKKIS